MTYKPWPTADQQQQEQGRTDVVGNYPLNPATGQPYDSANPMPVGATLTPPANQRVNAQAGDFVAGSLVDLATLLTLSGTPTDANTVASLMGRLTKIRDLLNAFGLDTTDRQKVSLYGKNAAAGDTALLLDALGQMTVEDFIRYQIMQGNGYSATTGLIATATNANAMVGLQVLGANVAKNILIYSMYATPGTNLEGDIRLNQGNANTPDTNLTASPTVVNQSGAANTAVATVKGAPASVATTTTVGTLRGQFSAGANAVIQLLQNGSIIYIPKSTNGYGVGYVKVATIGNSAAVSAEWVEWT